MGRRFTLTASITAGSQFLGTEFASQALKSNSRLIVREVLILKGAENAQVAISKAIVIGNATRLFPLAAVDVGVTTRAGITQTGEGSSDRVTDLLPGEQVQIVTTGATAAMFAAIQYEEIPNTAITAEQALTTPLVPR